MSLEHARTFTFAIMVFAQLAHSLNSRHDRRSLFAIGLWTNKPLWWAIGGSMLLQVAIVSIPQAQPPFKVAPFDPTHWLLALGLGLLPLLAMEG
jgi:P-type Ca2+ transporter type 2C